jgi:membrane protein implicated in regulation of membrane protease activity
MAALIWLIAGVLLLAGEILLGDLTLVMLGVAALAASGTAAVGGGTLAQVGVFAVVAVGLVTLARPVLRKRLHTGHTPTNVEALVGSKAIVVQTVDGNGGQVKIGGEVWSARAYDETEKLEPGRSVRVMEISGATAVVWGIE